MGKFVSHHQLSGDKDGSGMSDTGWLVWVELTKSVADGLGLLRMMSFMTWVLRMMSLVTRC